METAVRDDVIVTVFAESAMDEEDSSHHDLNFWVVRVPEAVFSTDPQDSLRVSNLHRKMFFVKGLVTFPHGVTPTHAHDAVSPSFSPSHVPSSCV